MRQAMLALAVVIAGCQKSDTNSSSVPTPPSAATPTKSLVDSGKPSFAQMITDLQTNPTDPKYKTQMMSIEMVVDEVKIQGKESYLVTGTAGPARIRVTFLTPANLDANRQAQTLSPGDTVSFYGDLGRFESGDPRPTLTVPSGSISRVVRRKGG